MTRQRKPVRRFLLHKVLPPIGWRMYRSLGRSWTYDSRNIEVLHRLIAAGQPVVGAFLHSRTFAMLHYFSLPEQGRWILMCSQSRDGEAMTRIEEGLGFRVARGSSGKGGARALVEMIKAQREDRGLNSCLAVDGSRGPRGIAQLGTITLAQKTGSLLLPVAASTRDCWRWNRSWDRTIIPKPGATVAVQAAEPIEDERGGTREPPPASRRYAVRAALRPRSANRLSRRGTAAIVRSPHHCPMNGPLTCATCYPCS
jgi:lysophospholipid acyltransferase (LPLAT)-like uncharacterized protein